MGKPHVIKLNTEEESYSSNLNEEHFKKRIEDLFEQKPLRLAGKFTSKNECAAYDKLVVIGWSVPNLRRKSAYLKGIITQGEKGTLINRLLGNFILCKIDSPKTN